MAEQGAQAGVAEPQEDEKIEQKVTVTDAGPAAKSVTVEIPEDRVSAKIEDRFGMLQGEATVPGFRIGRAPMKLLERRFGKAVRDEVKGQLISESYQAAVESEALDVIGEPDIKDFEQIELPESGPMAFTFEVEVAPDFELPNLEGIELSRPKSAVGDERVEKELEALRQRFGSMTEVVDGKIAADDYAQADVRVLAGKDAADDAEEIQHQPGAYVWVPGDSREFKGHVVGIVVNDLGKQLTGKQVGDEVRISMTGPSGHENEKIKDQPITLVLRIEMIQRVKPAELDDLAAQFGVESGEEVKTRIREMLEARVAQEQQTALRDQVCDYLAENVEMDLPKGLSSRQTARVLQRQAMNLAYQGVPEQEIEQRLAELRAGSEEQAARGLKLFFLLDKAAEHFNVDVSEAEVNAQVAQIAMQQQRRPEKLRQEMARSGQIEQLYHQVLEQKMLDKIIESAKVTETEPEADEEAKSEAKSTKKKSAKGGSVEKKSTKKKSSSKKKAGSE